MIEIGQIGRPFGLEGWSFLQSYTEPYDNIFTYTPWTIQHQGKTHTITPQAWKPHGRRLLVHLPNCHTPEEAKPWAQATIFMERQQLPPCQAGEYYHVDLINTEVINQDGQSLGQVSQVENYGPHDILVITGPSEVRRLPYVPSVIQHVDLAQQKITVMWWDPI